MIVKRESMIDGVKKEMDLPITQEQLDRYNSGQGHVQDIFPRLTPDQREFIMTGITPEQWNETFPSEDEESEENA